jgi:nicotinamide riboside transporter PnuC
MLTTIASSKLANTALNALSMLSGMLGAVMMAANVGHAPLAFGLFLISSSTSVILMWGNAQQRGLLATQIFFVGVNVFGLLRWSNVL